MVSAMTEEKSKTGHRQRLKERFIQDETTCRTEEALLELLLTYAIRLQEVQPLAHHLLVHFGILSALREADSKNLCQFDDLKDNTSTLLKLADWLRNHYQTVLCETDLDNNNNYQLELFEPVVELAAQTAKATPFSAELPSKKPNVPVRRGSQKNPIGSEELLSLMHHRGGERYESQPVPGATLADIDWQQVDRYLERREEARLSRIPRSIDKVELLRKLELIAPQDVPTVACLLFFGKEPQKFFPFHTIKAARFVDTTVLRFLDQAIITGTVPDMIDTAFEFVQRNTRNPARIEGLRRIDEDEYPAEAVREVLANAVVHRDFTMTDSAIRCQVFSNRIEIDSPGGLLPGMTVANLLTTSRFRNRKLGELLYHIGYIEAQGTEVRRVVELMTAAGLRSPRFDDQGYSLFVTLSGPDFDVPNATTTTA
ncbi:hypothetical protein OZ401_004989 (plasmid) [Candidatus Chlorohelix allophototropha]|uniref:ATP-dependent DNA helicase RecG C-terminal domain-containing protein n=2 Tax=Candidatus Chlorohelix allophototropha TaxID=3003348 RepID=A0ABY9BAW3_9CHLR|nr:hypothetical protein OZ401_004989 [Chloroflexota bacterium L227-S17]